MPSILACRPSPLQLMTTFQNLARRSSRMMAEKWTHQTICPWILGPRSQSRSKRSCRQQSAAHGPRRQVRSQCLQAVGDPCVSLVRKPCQRHRRLLSIGFQTSRTRLLQLAALVATGFRRRHLARRPGTVHWRQGHRTITRIDRAPTHRPGRLRATARGTTQARIIPPSPPSMATVIRFKLRFRYR